jgi:hypothetical protein
MLSKCANPDCGASFHYLGEGKLYEIRFDKPERQAVEQKKAAGRSERFWLCDRCSTQMTLAVDPSSKIVLMPLRQPLARRALAS